MLCLISAALKKADPIVDKLDIKARKPWNFRIFFKNFKVSRNLGANLSTMGPAFFRAAEHRGLRNCNNTSVIWSFFLQKRRHKSETWRKWKWKRKKKSVGEPHTPMFLNMLFSKIFGKFPARTQKLRSHEKKAFKISQIAKKTNVRKSDPETKVLV